MTRIPSAFKYQKQVWLLSASTGMLLALYLILMGRTIYNTLETQRTEKAISDIATALSQMEFSYLSLQAKINADLARSLGFVEPEKVIVARQSASQTTAFVRKDQI